MKRVQPIIEEAKKSVESISKSNLEWLRGLRIPPEPIRDVMQAVLRVFGNYDVSWNSMKVFLG